jgi:hypothetical protein
MCSAKMEVEEVRQHLKTIQQQDEGRAQWLQVLSHIFLFIYQTLISAKRLLTTYNDTVHNLKNAITDVENQTMTNRILLQEKKDLQSKLEGLQRSIVSRTPHVSPKVAHKNFQDRSAFVLVLIDADNDGYVVCFHFHVNEHV